MSDLVEETQPEAAESGDPAAAENSSLDVVPVEVAIDIGRKRLPLAEVAELGVGSIVTFDRMVGEPVDLTANGRKIALGEIIGVDGKFALRITSIRHES